MKIYFAGSITSGRHDQPIYKEIVRELQNYGQVLTELIGSPNLSNSGEALTDHEIHDRDVSWLLQSDCVIAEVTNPSLGVGYEIGLATTNQIPVLCLFRNTDGKRLSAMIAGSDKVHLFRYSKTDELPQVIKEFLETFMLAKTSKQ